MLKIAMAMVAFVSFASAQEVLFAPPEYRYLEEEEAVLEEIAAAEEAVLEAQDAEEEIVLLEDEIVSDSEEDAAE